MNGDGHSAEEQSSPPPPPAPAPRQSQSEGSIHLFRFAGIDVRLHLLWFAVLAYFVYTGKDEYHSPVWAGIECMGLFGIVLLHEFGHAFACRQTGGTANLILLWPLGGVAYVQPPPRPGAFLWSIAAGPLVNVALIPVTLLFYRWGSTQPWAHEAPDLLRCMASLAAINLGLLMFNMLPVYPLDGGQIVQSLLWFVIGRAYSLLVVSVIGFAAAAAAGVAAVANGEVRIPVTHMRISQMWGIFLAIFMVRRSAAAFKQAQLMIKLQGMRRINGQACPACGERPFADNVWTCDQCGVNYNPFDTGNACPNCGRKHEKIQCPFCRESSEPERWRR